MEPPSAALFPTGLPLFRHAPPESIRRIADATARVELGAGDYLFRAEERATDMHVVLSGRLEIVSSDGRVLREVGPGSVLGELAVVVGSARSASVRARRDSELLSIDGFRFPRVSLIRGRRAAAMLERVFGDVALESLPLSAFTVTPTSSRARSSSIGAGTSAAEGQPAPRRRRRPRQPPGRRDGRAGRRTHSRGRRGPQARSAGRDEERFALPTIMETLARATVLGSVERSERNRRLAALTVVPDVQQVALRDFAELDRAVEAGRIATAAALDDGGAEVLRAALGP